MKYYYYACLILASIGSSANADVTVKKNGFYSNAESFSYSTANPLTAYLNVLIGPEPDNGTYAFSRNLIEFGYRLNRFEMALVHRNDQNLEFSPGAAQFAYLNKNAKKIPAGERYPVDVYANQYQLTGAKFGYTLPISSAFELFSYYSHYYASEAVYGYMGKDPEGEGGYIGVTNVQLDGQTISALDGELYVDYYYTRDPLFRRKTNAPSGTGYSIDFGFRWHVLPGLYINAGFYDALGEISWSNLPRTIATATSQIVIIGDDGLIDTNPNFEGRETFGDLTQKLTKRERVNVDYRYKNYAFGYEFDHMPLVGFHRLNAGYYWSDRWGASASYDFTSDAIGIKLLMPAGNLAITVDNFNLDLAHTIGFSWSLGVYF